MVIIIDNNLLLDLIFGFVQEKRRNNLVNIRKNLVYVWIILFETVFRVIFLSYFSRPEGYLYCICLSLFYLCAGLMWRPLFK